MTGKFGAEVAERWSEDAYADTGRYLSHRAELVRTLGPPLVPGDRVLDLACGDGGLADFLLPHGISYLGVDASPAMVEAARSRLGARAELAVADLNDYRPSAPGAATTVFRALYYTVDRRAFFGRVSEFTNKKLLFDLDPRRFRLDDVRTELELAGFDRLDLRPFFVPQSVALPGPLLALLLAAEHVGPVARALLRFRFTYVCAASRTGRSRR